MKTGAGSDPFADEDDTPIDETRSDSSAHQNAERSGDADSADTSVDTEETPVPPGETDADERGDSGRPRSRGDLPYVLRRDGTKDGRVRKTVYLREEFVDEESDFRAAVADALDLDAGDVSKFDLRAAMYRAALRDPDAVADVLVEDGYDLL